jgi:soluble lytic murein transglycosylase-like protein
MRTTICATIAMLATSLPGNTAHAGPPLARRTCLADAAHYHRVSPRLLEAIATVESGGNPQALNRNANGTADVGLMQINTTWLPALSRHGITQEALYDPCVNTYVGAWILSRNIAQLGLTWNAIGAYNARDPVRRIAYARKVYQALPPASDSTPPDGDAQARVAIPRDERQRDVPPAMAPIGWEALP